MKLNEKKFFELAKENGFEAADLVFSHSYSLSCSTYHKEVESLSESDSYSVTGRGIVNGKFGLRVLLHRMRTPDGRGAAERDANPRVPGAAVAAGAAVFPPDRKRKHCADAAPLHADGVRRAGRHDRDDPGAAPHAAFPGRRRERRPSSAAETLPPFRGVTPGLLCFRPHSLFGSVLRRIALSFCLRPVSFSVRISPRFGRGAGGLAGFSGALRSKRPRFFAESI